MKPKPEPMPFIQLTTESGPAEVYTYLTQLARSPHSYHLDDGVEDILWGAGNAPTEDDYRLMLSNEKIFRNLCDEGWMTWDEIWEHYGSAWSCFEREQGLTE